MTKITVALAALALAAACDDGGAGGPQPEGPCDAITRDVPDEGGEHVPVGEPVTYGTNPPASGPHYQAWARWSRVYADPIARGYWLHNLEHGGVALLYRCDGGCPEVVARLDAFARALPADPACVAPITARWLVTPDPLLPDGVQIAATAWGWTYTASCLDEVTLRGFYDARYARAPEDTCAEGTTPPITVPSVDAGAGDAG